LNNLQEQISRLDSRTLPPVNVLGLFWVRGHLKSLEWHYSIDRTRVPIRLSL